VFKGLQLNGKIAAYDMYSVLLESQGRLQLIFKHAISTIDFPERIRLNFDGGSGSGPRRGPRKDGGASSDGPSDGPSDDDGAADEGDED